MTEENLENRFRHGRNGDHLMGVFFECDLCHFRNCNLRNPCLDSSKDNYTLICIWRAILDVMWSRESSTVSSNLSRCELNCRDVGVSLSIKDPLPVHGRDDISNRVGMKPALI